MGSDGMAWDEIGCGGMGLGAMEWDTMGWHGTGLDGEWDGISRLQRMLTWKLTTLLILAVSDAKRDVKAPVSFTSAHYT